MLLYSPSHLPHLNVPQLGHGQPIVAMAAHASEPLLATADDGTLKIWQPLAEQETSEQARWVEVASLGLSGPVVQLQWQAETLTAQRGEAVYAWHWQKDVLNLEPIPSTLQSIAGAPVFEDSQYLQKLAPTEHTLFVLYAGRWEYWEYREHDSEWKLRHTEPVRAADVETPFLVHQYQDNVAVVVDRTVVFLDTKTENAATRGSTVYYGRPLAFSQTGDTLLWASGDTLFTTKVKPDGEILQHQIMQYEAPYDTWPIYWSHAVAAPSGGFWVADQHRCNASFISEELTIEVTLQGEGGWVSALCFSDNALFLGGGQNGTLCQLTLPELTPEQIYDYPAQPVEQLQIHGDVLWAQSTGALHGYSKNASAPLNLPAPEKPWHKALHNGALQYACATPTGCVVQFEHKGKNILQVFNARQNRWHARQNLPADALLLGVMNHESHLEVLLDHPTRDGDFKCMNLKTGDITPFDCDLEIEVVRWFPELELLGISGENELQIWQYNSGWQLLHHLYQDAFFLAFELGLDATGRHSCYTLDSKGVFKHFQLATTDESLACPLKTTLPSWNKKFEDSVCSISQNGEYIALGAEDVPLHLWRKQGESFVLKQKALVLHSDKASW